MIYLAIILSILLISTGADSDAEDTSESSDLESSTMETSATELPSSEEEQVLENKEFDQQIESKYYGEGGICRPILYLWSDHVSFSLLSLQQQNKKSKFCLKKMKKL